MLKDRIKIAVTSSDHLLPGIEVQVEVANGVAGGGIIHPPLLHILMPHLNNAKLSLQQSSMPKYLPAFYFGEFQAQNPLVDVH